MKYLIVFSLLILSGCQSTPTDLPVVAKTESSAVSATGFSGRKEPILKAEYVESVLGAPTVRRRENPSEVWVYAQNSCVLFIYMNEGAEVKHMEIGTPAFDKSEKVSVECLKTASKLR